MLIECLPLSGKGGGGGQFLFKKTKDLSHLRPRGRKEGVASGGGKKEGNFYSECRAKSGPFPNSEERRNCSRKKRSFNEKGSERFLMEKRKGDPSTLSLGAAF